MVKRYLHVECSICKSKMRLIDWDLHECPGGLEFDPLGKSSHESGAKLDAGKNRLALVLNGFARALEETGKVGTYGAKKYTDNGWMNVPSGVERYTDAMYRHLLEEAKHKPFDKDTGLLHAAHTAWNALARLDLMLRDVEELVGTSLPEKQDSRS